MNWPTFRGTEAQGVETHFAYGVRAIIRQLKITSSAPVRPDTDVVEGRGQSSCLDQRTSLTSKQVFSDADSGDWPQPISIKTLP